MKLLKVLGLGLIIWVIGLFWPAIGQLFAQPMSLHFAAALGLAGLILIGLAYWLEQRMAHNDNYKTQNFQTQITQPITTATHSQPTCPMPAIRAHSASRPTRPVAI